MGSCQAESDRALNETNENRSREKNAGHEGHRQAPPYTLYLHTTWKLHAARVWYQSTS